LKIQILGTGCPKCKKLAANAEKAVEASGVDAQIEKVEDIPEIVKFGVISTPALAIDGDVKSAGKILSVEQVQQMLEGE
jgi:small redox-active disulfide protein 2